MLQNYSFDLDLAWVRFHNLQFSVTVHTFENVYTPHKDFTETKTQDGALAVACSRLSYAGGRKTAPCRFEARAWEEQGAMRVKLFVEMQQEVRCVRLLLRARAGGEIISRVDSTPLAVTPQGVTLTYPEPWRTLATPLVVVRTAQGYDSYRSLDTRVTTKRFVFAGTARGMAVELIYDQPATEIGVQCDVPAWEIRSAGVLDEIYGPHIAHIKEAYCIEEWEQRTDLPDWARGLSLVIALHGMHWSGKIFNTYAQMLEKLAYLAKEIDPKRVLVYLPGFEGRYYWQYGAYGACDELGGEGGLKRLMECAHALGYHIVPMLGANIVNTNTPGFERFGVASQFITAGGIYTKNIVDWDNSRGYDHGWCAYLNPGAPQWQNRLVGQVCALFKTYGFDGVYLDITGMWIDDANYDVAQGTRQLVQRIRSGCGAECLVLGEAWYDGIADVFPFVQNGHTDGVMHYYDEIYPSSFTRFCRMFGHLCLGDVGSESTGVHELGHNETTALPLRRGIIPTMTLLGDTLEKNLDGVLAIVQQAKKYAARYYSNLTND